MIWSISKDILNTYNLMCKSCTQIPLLLIVDWLIYKLHVLSTPFALRHLFRLNDFHASVSLSVRNLKAYKKGGPWKFSSFNTISQDCKGKLVIPGTKRKLTTHMIEMKYRAITEVEKGIKSEPKLRNTH
jgi:hypothetical protein